MTQTKGETQPATGPRALRSQLPMKVTVEIAPTPASAAKWLNACRERVRQKTEEKKTA